MSLEPQTTAKVRLTTTKGDIEIELWAKETPITSRIFLNNVLNGKFNDWEFNRIISNFIAQVDGNLSQELFEDEFNPRLRFNKRGILGSVNIDSRNSNNGKFFITLNEAPNLNNKNTVFGKVVGESIYNLVKISEGKMNDDGETPLYPVKIIRTEVLIPYFDDLKKEEAFPAEEERPQLKSKKSKKTAKKSKVKLNLGDDEEDETEIVIKMKSAHELLDDRKLSKEQPVVKEDTKFSDSKESDESNGKSPLKETEIRPILSTKDETDANDKVDDTLIENPPHQTSNQAISKQKDKYGKAHGVALKRSDKELRELETLNILKNFKTKIANYKNTPSKETTSNVSDDDFDNLDNHESDDDIYSHSLKFEDNPKNFQSVEEDSLITIDEQNIRKRTNDEFYRTKQTPTILSKRTKPN